MRTGGIATIILLVLIVASIVARLYSGKRRKKVRAGGRPGRQAPAPAPPAQGGPAVAPQQRWKYPWMTNNWWWAKYVLTYIGVHLVLWYFFYYEGDRAQGVYYKAFLSQLSFWVCQGLLALAFTLGRKDTDNDPKKKPGFNAFGNALIALVILGNAYLLGHYIIGGWKADASKIVPYPTTVTATTQATAPNTGDSAKPSPIPEKKRGRSPAKATTVSATTSGCADVPDESKLSQEQKENRKKAYEFFEKRLGMAEAVKMIGHAWVESSFLQFDKNKQVTMNLGRNDNNTVDFGFMGINTVHIRPMEKECPKCDVKTFEGNLEASLWVLKAQGHGAWKGKKSCDTNEVTLLSTTARTARAPGKTNVQAEAKPIYRILKPGEWCEPIKVGPGKTAHMVVSGKPRRIYRRIDGNDATNCELGNGCKRVPTADTVEYSSAENGESFGIQITVK